MIKKIGFFGGAFSPITEGHIEVARAALYKVNKVIFLPCNNHPWGKELISFKHRFKMCQLAIRSNTFRGVSEGPFEVKKFETESSGDTFSLINYFKQKPYYKKHDLFFIIGMDEANNFIKWKNYKKLLKIIKFIVISRPRTKISTQTIDLFRDHIILKESIPKTSSTRIRKDLLNYYKTKKVTTHLRRNLNPEVFKYIIKNNLYK
jgi:nicotinate-nucleotide adenylyltransferase